MDADKHFSWAAARCAARECCRADLAQKLEARGLDADGVVAVLNRLEQEGYIDEARYARAFVHDKTLYDRWGHHKTAQALRLKGIASGCIARAMTAVGDDEYNDILHSVVEAKARTLANAPLRDRRQRVARFAIGRGFEPDRVFRAIDDLLGDAPCDGCE